MKTLVVLPNWLGDLVNASPLLQLLKKQGHELYAMAHGGVAELASLIPEISGVIEPPFSRHGLSYKKLKERLRFAQKVITPYCFEQAIVLPNSAKSALIPWFAGIKVRVGYRGEMRYGLINRMHFDPVLKKAKSGYKVRRNVASFYGALAFKPSTLAPKREQLPKPFFKPPFDTSLPRHNYAVLAMGAEFGPAKRWGYQNYAELAQILVNTKGVKEIVLLGTPKEQDLSTYFMSYLKDKGYRVKTTDLCGHTNLIQAAQWIAQSFLFIGNDSGLSHMAAALNTPTLGVYGPTDPRHAPPLGTNARTVSLHLPCAPCQQRVCPLGHNHCMTQLHASIAIEQIEKVLTLH